MKKSHRIWNKNNPNNKVKKGEVIHHKDGNHNNDAPENQQKMTLKRHTSLHHKGKVPSNKGVPMSEEQKRKIATSHLGQKRSKEARRNMSLAKKGKEFTEKHKKNLSKARQGRIVTEETKKKLSISAKQYWRKRRVA
jgi:hypothetical protein|tara:strand:+ start:8300 stop:8710 length:411 start_codon:yes stop_codon:yes gene_type:complete